MPVASDIKLGADGKYYARVDACTWMEYGRFPDPTQSGDVVVGLQTPCLPSEIVIFNPKTKRVDHMIA